MKRLYVRFSVICAILIGVFVSAFAQVPSTMNYQAVVRDDQGLLVSEKPIGVRIAIINSNNTEVFAETQVVETNANGLLTVEIGNGDKLAGDLMDINWAADTYDIVIGIDISGGSSYDIESVQSIMAVPYAFCAKTVETIDYKKVINVPTIPSKTSDLENDAGYVTSSELAAAVAETVVPTKVSELENDAHYVAAESLDVYAKKEDLTQIDLSEYVKVAELPVVPTKISELENDANFVTSEDLQTAVQTVVVPTKVSELENDAEYVTNTAMAEFVKASDLADYAKTADIPEVPTKISALENDAEYLTSSSLADYAKTSDLADYAKTVDIPEVPTKVSAFENDAEYLTSSSLADYAKTADIPEVPTKVSAFENDAEYLTSSSLTDYAKTEDLPTKVSELENDSKYIKEDDINAIVLEILYAAFQDPEVRDAIIEDILKDTDAMKKYGSEIVDMVLADNDYVKTIGNKFITYLTSNPDLLIAAVQKAIAVAKENKDMVKDIAQSLLNDESFKSYVKTAIKSYATESTIKEIIQSVGEDKIVAIIKDLGITEAVVADIDIAEMIESSNIVSTVTSNLESTLESKIQEVMSSFMTYSAVAVASNVSVSGSTITGACASEAVTGVSATIFSYGICYGTTPYPSAQTTYVEVGTAAGQNTFQTAALAAGTYYVYPYVSSNKGMYYGEIQKVVVE